jgi:hypothetical protein
MCPLFLSLKTRFFFVVDVFQAIPEISSLCLGMNYDVQGSADSSVPCSVVGMFEEAVAADRRCEVMPVIAKAASWVN